MTMQPYGAGYPQGGNLQTTDQKAGNTAELICAWVLTVLTLGYMLPWAIAASRGKSNSVAVALVNLFAGWTFVGWVAALVMACGAHQQRMPSIVVNAQATAIAAVPAGWYPDPQSVGVPQQRYWDGQLWTEHIHAG
jgi:hypothetical protein